jgi:hypothetical protein
MEQTMEKSFSDMTSDEKVAYLVDGLSNVLFCISLEARKSLSPLGFTPETAKSYKLLALIEGTEFGHHETSGAMDWLDHLRATLAEDYDVDGLYESEDEDDEESEDESDELEEVRA